MKDNCGIDSKKWYPALFYRFDCFAQFSKFITQIDKFTLTHHSHFN